jgi:hypothetical protein
MPLSGLMPGRAALPPRAAQSLFQGHLAVRPSDDSRVRVGSSVPSGGEGPPSGLARHASNHFTAARRHLR